MNSFFINILFFLMITISLFQIKLKKCPLRKLIILIMNKILLHRPVFIIFLLNYEKQTKLTEDVESDLANCLIC